MGSDNLHYWKLAMGGTDGGITLDASSATAIATALEAQMIDVRAAATFSVLTGNVSYSVATATTINFKVDNGLTGISVSPGLLFSGYGRHFTDIQITAGQVTYYSRGDD